MGRGVYTSRVPYNTNGEASRKTAKPDTYAGAKLQEALMQRHFLD